MKAATSITSKSARGQRNKTAATIRLSLCIPVPPVVSAFRALGASVIRAYGVISAILHEIFDEAAYERFLTQHHQTASVEAYAAFRRDHEALTVRRPRCC